MAIPTDEPTTRLDEFDADEWFEVCRRLRPEVTREEFDQMWAEFAALKAARSECANRLPA